MNKTININLAGIIIHVDEDAYKLLTDYLVSIKSTFSNTEGGDEIVMDIESRMAELFQGRLNTSKQVINLQDVNEVINILGKPEDYLDEDYEETKSSNQDSGNSSTYESYHGPKRLYRNPDDKIVAGVASGVAAYFNLDPVWVRLIWVALTLGYGTGFWLYIILWIVLPEAVTTAQKLHMKGEPINISNIEKSVREEIKGVQNRMENFAKSGEMKRTGSKLRNALEDIIQFFLTLVKGILGFLVKFIGIVLLFVGLFLLVVVFSFLFGHGIEINDNNVLFTDLGPYLDAVLAKGYSVTYVWLAVILLLAAPVVGAIMLAVRILFNYRGVGMRISLATAGIASLIGFILLINLGIRMGRDFEHRESFTKVEELSMVKSNSVRLFTDTKDYDSDDADKPWVIRDSKIVLDDIRFNIVPSEGNNPSLSIKSYAHGRTRKSARSLASEFEYGIAQDSDRVYLDGYFTIDEDHKYRGQELYVTLNLPVGYRVYLDESMNTIIHDIKNIEDVYDMDMIGHWWIMTSKGLTCQDCPIEYKSSKSDDDQTIDEWQKKWEEEAEEMESKRETPSRKTNPVRREKLEGVQAGVSPFNWNLPSFSILRSLPLVSM